MAATDIAGQPTVMPAVKVASQRTTSLKHRLPLFICALMCSVGIAFAWAAYREVERALRLSGHERIVRAATQVSDLLSQTIAARTTEMKRVLADPELQQLVQGQQFSNLVSVPAIFQALQARSPQASIWLYDANGNALAYKGPKDQTWVAPDPSRASKVPQEGIGPLYVDNGHAAFRTTAAIPSSDPGAVPIAFVSIERPLAASAAVGLIERLIGSSASLKMGNASRDVWTDLSAPVPAPPVADLEAPASYVNAQGEARLGTAAAVKGAPWLIWVDMPEAALLDPAQTLLRRMVPITFIVVAIAALGAYVMSARITKPLSDLVGAAEGLESGDYSRRVTTTAKDEIGRLALAFNSMADRVSDTHHDLESRVQARTAELAQTVEALERAQAEIVQKERLAMLGQLASGVGHELRNPLGVMTNAVYFLQMIQPNAPDQVTEYLGILRHQIGLAEKIVGDLLDFARQRAPQRQSVSLRQLVDDQVARMGPLQSIAVKREGLDTLPAVSIDPVQIGQVLFNLLTNAQQAMESGGTLTIRGRTSGDQVVIDVCDTGTGIAPDVMARIFEPLFTTKARGIGLGLAVSRTLAAANSGSLTAASTPDEGATFTLTLPASKAGQ